MDDTVRAALVEATRRFREAGIPFLVGGSALLHALGLVDRVRDLDLVFRAGDRRAVERLLQAATGSAPETRLRIDPESGEPAWRATHRFRGVTLDMVGGAAFGYPGGFVARPPFRPGPTWHLDGEEVPLVPPEHWLLAYRYARPDRAALLEPHVPPAAWERLLAEIGAPPGFDGTVPPTPA